jgi:hypothetical protein
MARMLERVTTKRREKPKRLPASRLVAQFPGSM